MKNQRTVSNKLNVRQMQAFAALCLWQFCKQLGIEHSAVSELFHHLMSILTTPSLVDWEQKGRSIAMTARGDPLPEEVANTLKPDNLDVFSALVESCVEVGIVDMYGASSDQPKRFLEKCVWILNHSGIKLPELNELTQYRRGDDEWGNPIAEAELEKILEIYGANSV